MNSNLFHNIINVVTLLIGLLTAILVATGCVESPDGNLTCEGSFVSAELVGWAVAILMFLKMLVNVVRDGFGGLAKKQPPVK